MNNVLRNGVAILLVLLVLFTTVLAILSVWDVIQVEDVLMKLLGTLLIIFISSAVILFIFAVIYKQSDQKSQTGQKQKVQGQGQPQPAGSAE